MSNLSPALLRFGDVSVRLSVELGRTDMPLRDVLSLGQGSVVALNRLTDELLDITANGKVVAQGEVIAQDGKFALRIINLVGADPSAAGAAPPMPMAPGAPDLAASPRADMSTAMPGAAMPNPHPAAAATTPPAHEPPIQPQSFAPSPSQTTPSPASAADVANGLPAEAPNEEPEPQSDASTELASDKVTDDGDDLDDLLDSTLDELTGALDEIAPEDGGSAAGVDGDQTS